MPRESQVLDADLACEAIPVGAPVVLVRGTVIESQHGPFIAPRGDFYLIKALGVAYRSWGRPLYQGDSPLDAEPAPSAAPPVTPTVLELLLYFRKALGHLAATIDVFEEFYMNPAGAALVDRATLPGFFTTVGLALESEIALSIMRLTDPPNDRANQNLSMRQLVRALDATQLSESSRAELALGLGVLEQAVAPLRPWRDKYLAHNDLVEAFTGRIDDVSIGVIREALVRLSMLYMSVAHEVAPTLASYPGHVFHDGSTRRLFELIEKGLAAEQAAPVPGD